MFVRTPDRGTAPGRAPIPELAIVTLVHAVSVDGRDLPAGAKGIVVGAYADGNGYEVEFHLPCHCVVTLSAVDIAA